MTDTYACGITMERPKGNLYEILGMDSSALDSNIRHLGIESMTLDQRYAWKALSDSKYRAVYDRNQNTDDLYRAGFFDDGLSYLVNSVGQRLFMTTPFDKIDIAKYREAVANGQQDKIAVLVTTGGMAPIHNGHMAMMEEARRLAEADGWTVIGGYFAPGHDSYVGQKYNGTAAIPAEHRCAMVELACRNSDWLMCDPWAARYVEAEINFTDVVKRLETYLNQFVGAYFAQVLYVYGSDNEGFGEALPDRSYMVTRTAISSKLAREGQHDHLDPSVRDYLLGWQTPENNGLPYLIRDDSSLCVDAPKSKITAFKDSLASLLQTIFEEAGEPREVCYLGVEDQIVKASEVIGNRPVISLEPFFRNPKNQTYLIESTRYFGVSSDQFKPKYRGARPESPSLSEQANAIPSGSYVLVEDDSVTGETIAMALSLLPKDVLVEQQVLLSDFASYQGTDYHDVVDLRDFIIGSKNGGLGVLMAFNTTGRAPYLMPYVSLRSRAKIPASWEKTFSLEVWKMNLEFYKDTNLLIRDVYPAFLHFARAAGFPSFISLEAFCRHHIEMLENRH